MGSSPPRPTQPCPRLAFLYNAASTDLHYPLLLPSEVPLRHVASASPRETIVAHKTLQHGRPPRQEITVLAKNRVSTNCAARRYLVALVISRVVSITYPYQPIH